MPPSNTLRGLFAWLALSFFVALLGGVASASAGEFYQVLARPGWAPPGWVFAPVWSLLYLLMGVAAWLVWGEKGFAGAAGALYLYLAQLAVNGLWSWLFFAWHLGFWAFADVALLWVLIVATGVAFWRVQPVAGLLLLPYLAWVSFASALAFTVWQMNPQWLG